MLPDSLELLTNLSDKPLLYIYYVLGTLLGTGDTAENKTMKLLSSHSLDSSRGNGIHS